MGKAGEKEDKGEREATEHPLSLTFERKRKLIMYPVDIIKES